MSTERARGGQAQRPARHDDPVSRIIQNTSPLLDDQLTEETGTIDLG